MDTDTACPIFSQEQLDKIREEIRKEEYDEAREQVASLNELCPPSLFGGKKNKKRLKGGNIQISADTFKKICNGLYLVIIAYLILMPSAAMEGIINGIHSIYTGRCRNALDQIYGVIGFGNPVCQVYNAAMATIINALNKDALAIGTVTAFVTLALKTPVIIDGSIKVITYQLALLAAPSGIISDEARAQLLNEALGVKPSLLEGATPTQKSTIERLLPGSLSQRLGISIAAPEEPPDSRAVSGGRKTRNTRKTRKTRKTRNGKKAKKSNRIKKSQKRKTNKH